MKNSVSTIVKMIATAIIILGLFSSVAIAIKYGVSYKVSLDGLETSRNIEKTIVIVLIGIVATLIIGCILYSLGEIIQKLQNIEYLSYHTNSNQNNTSNPNNSSNQVSTAIKPTNENDKCVILK